MKNLITATVIIAILALAGFQLSKWSYGQGLKQNRHEQRLALEDEYNSGVLVGTNKTWGLCNDKFTDALELRGIQCSNWQKCDCPRESNVVELCTPNEDYEDMIQQRDDEIQRLNSLLLNYMYK